MPACRAMRRSAHHFQQTLALFKALAHPEVTTSCRSVLEAQSKPDRRREMRKLVFIAAVQFLAITLVITNVEAQHIPVLRYDVSEGLAGSKVQAIYQSSKGYMWFATQEG